jgi:alkylation response protein AidB-like acyl-CoA dehydrogenase
VSLSCSWDADGYFPIDTIRAAAKLGFGGIYVNDDVGGCSLGRLDAALVFEALAQGDVSVTAYLTIHNMVCGIIDKYGTEAQRQHYLPDLVAMNTLASYCLTEPGDPFIGCKQPPSVLAAAAGRLA